MSSVKRYHFPTEQTEDSVHCIVVCIDHYLTPKAMADSSDERSSGDAVQSRLKEQLKDWRELVLRLHSLLIWQTSEASPLILWAVVSLVFAVIWYLDVSVLTTLSVLAMMGSVIDYGLPVVNTYLFDPSKWSSSDETKLEKICSELSTNWTVIAASYREWQHMKSANPRLYYAVLLSSLLGLSWIGNVVHNLLLTYLLVVFVVLFPGLKHKGLIDKYSALVLSYVCKLKRN
ncbi:unnamed protein product [Medioppia subpectinata]|uniref:RETREG1-3/ARL6IP-like N-terminal reticulon-homology domain-containing protein n=1 Tax=Medioppia subpectinata TaxID=1979941 RepID=A0A7R9QAS1_9ACAR|nr:unnamed protein product [Medioppia subpectinata]CAG2117202.1 unnamed protein product [Medioppia subpectinata]